MRIEIINGSVEYDGNTVLSEINFSVSDKEKIALVGRNGSGKTSILKCISGEVPLVSGTGDEKILVFDIGRAENRISSTGVFERRTDSPAGNFVGVQGRRRA